MAIKVTYQQKKERLRASADTAALFLFCTIPQFHTEAGECKEANTYIMQLTEVLCHYLKNDYLALAGKQNGVRFPISAYILPNIHRIDNALLSLELTIKTTQRHLTLYEKHIFLHFAKEGKIPLTNRRLVGKKTDSLVISGNDAIEISTQKVYSLHKKYRI